MQECIQCKKEFSFDERDHEFFRLFDVPPPRRCHPCRRRAQLIWSNEFLLYPRKCDLTGKQILSMYPESAPFPVYNGKDWWGNSFDPFSYGRDIDFSRPFFEQYHELEIAVPHAARYVLESTVENSDYINYCSSTKNCYLIFDGDFDENCYYSSAIQHCKDSADGLRLRESELCYECVDCLKCYKCLYCQNADNSNEFTFGYNLSNCTNCFGCVNVKNAQYYWFNEKLSEEEYEKRLSSIDLSRRSVVQEWREKFEEHKKKFPKAYMHGVNNQDCTGDYLINSKNAIECYDGFRVEDSKYCEATFMPAKDSYETFEIGENASRIYYTADCGLGSYNVRFSFMIVEGCSDVDYSMFGKSLHNSFGCMGVLKGQYCILNKQYAKDDYEKLRAKLIAHMKETGEWGEFFPPEYSPFAYNTSNAGIFMPLSKEKAIEKGFRWDDSADIKRGEYVETPDSIKDVDDSWCDKVLADKDTGQKFKYVRQELEFYRRMNIPAPDKSFLERHKARMAKRNPKQLWSRECDCTVATHTKHYENKRHSLPTGRQANAMRNPDGSEKHGIPPYTPFEKGVTGRDDVRGARDDSGGAFCKRPFQTTWDPARGERVYCKECYLEEVV